MKLLKKKTFVALAVIFGSWIFAWQGIFTPKASAITTVATILALFYFLSDKDSINLFTELWGILIKLKKQAAG